jgi:hypothetical protein
MTSLLKWLAQRRLERREREEAKEQLWQKWREQQEARVAAIKALPLDEVKRRAEALLADPLHFRCIGAPPDEVERQGLEKDAPHLREFFTKYAIVEPFVGGWQVTRSGVAAWEQKDGTCVESDRIVAIATTLTGDELYAIKPGEEAIYYIDLEDPPDVESEPECDYPTIYHFLLSIDEQYEATPPPPT